MSVRRERWDCHMHLFGPSDRYPLSPHAGYQPRDATLSAYDRMADALGITHSLIVQASPYGTDNRLVLDTLRANPERFRGIIAIDRPLSLEVGRDLAALGVRGVRVNLFQSGGAPAEPALASADVLRALRWPVQVVSRPAQAFDLLPLLERLGLAVVLDHFLLMDPPNQPEMSRLLRALDTGRVWVKTSAPYRISRSGPPDYADIGVIARQLYDARPDRMLWATDWPHPDFSDHRPDTADARALFERWGVPAEALVMAEQDNPRALYA